MGTTNFDIVDATALAVSGSNIVAVTSTGTAASVAFVNTDATNTSARINALVSELTNIGLLA